MVELTDSQCLNASENGEYVPPVIEVETSSRCARETHQKNGDISNKKTIDKGDKLSDSKRLSAFKNGDKNPSGTAMVNETCSKLTIEPLEQGVKSVQS